MTNEKVIQLLADKLGVAAEKIMEVGVKYTFYRGIVDLVLGVVLLLVSYRVYKQIKKMINKGNDEAAVVLVSTLLLGLALAGVLFVYVGVLAVVFPEGKFMTEIISKIAR